MTSEEKRNRKQQAIAGALLNTALDRLGELDAPYVLIIGGKLISNVSEQTARVTVCDTAQLLDAIHEKRVDAEAERTVFGFTDSGSDDGDMKQA
jgi:hypothetical protein